MGSIPLETEEELQMIKDDLLFPVILEVLEKDIREMDTLHLKMANAYVKFLRTVQDAVSEEAHRVRRELRERGIRIYNRERTPSGIRIEYLCRGYHHRMFLLWSHVRLGVEERMARHMQTEPVPGGSRGG